MNTSRRVSGDADDILRPYRHAALHHLRRRDKIAQRLVVAARDTLAGFDLVFKDGKLLQEDRRLQRIEPRVQADADVVVFLRALSVAAQRTDEGCERIIIGEDRAAVPVAAKRFSGKETRRRERTERARAPPFVGRAAGLRGIADERQPVRGAKGFKRIVIGGLAEQIDGDDRARA